MTQSFQWCWHPGRMACSKWQISVRPEDSIFGINTFSGWRETMITWNLYCTVVASLHIIWAACETGPAAAEDMVLLADKLMPGSSWSFFCLLGGINYNIFALWLNSSSSPCLEVDADSMVETFFEVQNSLLFIPIMIAYSLRCSLELEFCFRPDQATLLAPPQHRTHRHAQKPAFVCSLHKNSIDLTGFAWLDEASFLAEIRRDKPG